MGDTGPGTGTRAYPKALAQLLGMKFKQVSGFASSADVFLAMERGEVEGTCESLDSIKGRRPDWIPNGRSRSCFKAARSRNPELKGVPFVLDFARTDEERQLLEFL